MTDHDRPILNADDPVDLFGQLHDELLAARTLLVLTTPGDPRRRAAVDALERADDLIREARHLFVDPETGTRLHPLVERRLAVEAQYSGGGSC